MWKIIPRSIPGAPNTLRVLLRGDKSVWECFAPPPQAGSGFSQLPLWNVGIPMECWSAGAQSHPCSILALILRDQTLSSQLSSIQGAIPTLWPHQNSPCGAAGMGFSRWKTIPRILISPRNCGRVPFSHPRKPRDVLGILGMNPWLPRDPSVVIPEAEGRSVGSGTAFPIRGGLERSNSSGSGLETSQFGRERPFLPKLLAGKPRLGTPGG